VNDWRCWKEALIGEAGAIAHFLIKISLQSPGKKIHVGKIEGATQKHFNIPLIAFDIRMT
jgi:hypothetical protein